MMKVQGKHLLFLILTGLLTVFFLCFIWGNSLQNGTESNAASMRFAEPLEKLADWEMERAEEEAAQKSAELTAAARAAGDPDAVVTVEPKKSFLNLLRDQSSDHSLNYIVRKIAHFTEYTGYGLLLSLLLLLYSPSPICRRLPAVALCGVLTALVDETLQLFRTRTPLVTDVWIDFFGFIFGLCLALLLRTFSLRRSKIKAS